MPKDISELTIKELETLYNETHVAYHNCRGDYKDLMFLDALNVEIEKRDLKWHGIELEG